MIKRNGPRTLLLALTLAVTPSIGIGQAPCPALIPSDHASLGCHGRRLLDQGESERAVAMLEQAIALNGNVARYHLSLALALQAEAGKASMIRAPGLAKRALAELGRAVELDPTSTEARWNHLAMLVQAPSFLGGSVPEARAHAVILLEQHPMRGHLGMGLVLEQENALAGAEREFLAAIRVSPDSEVAYGNTGAFYRRRERWNDAVAMQERQLMVLGSAGAPARISIANYNLGLALEKLGRSARAKAAFEAAVAANPNNENARTALARVSK